jgi:chromate transporter
VAAIGAGALFGWWLIAAPPGASGHVGIAFSRTLGVAALLVFFLLLGGFPLLAAATGNHAVALIDSFYRTGALVFGGGHVVLPLLQEAVVPPGWIGVDRFLAGYGAAQAMPGPLFTFAAYLGAAMTPAPTGAAGGLLCLAAIYLPSFLLLIGVLPFWDGLRRRAPVQSALRGVNATVVGLLLAALYTPVWTSAIGAPHDFAMALVAFLLLAIWKFPPWLVVILGALAAAAFG